MHPVKILILLTVAVMASGGGLAAEVAPTPIVSDGSSWAAPAVEQSASDVRGAAVPVEYDADGSGAVG